MSHRYVTRVADYEPAPVLASLPPACQAPRPTRLHQSRTRPAGIERQTHLREQSPPPQAVAFADAAMRRVLEVMDRRRPVAQLRPLLA
ncbi:MAG: Rv3235 family protein, partial [[Mycobacterium] stephanolepidis]